jgi:hypothetical protein
MNIKGIPYYTINTALLQSENSIDRQARLNILLQNEAELTPKLYSILGSLENDYIVSLSISLLLSININKNFLAKIYLLLVLNKSQRGQRLVPLFTENEHQKDIVNIDSIKEYLNRQGIRDIEFPVFNYTANSHQISSNSLLLLVKDQSTDWQKEFSQIDISANTIIIALTEQTNKLIPNDDWMKSLAFYEKVPLLPAIISNFYIEKEEFETERNLWKKRALLYQDFLSLSKKVQEKEYYEVLDWYHKEYEALPLWYKQFGHIIKVIIGKRRFRSLFDDNVKKYKD